MLGEQRNICIVESEKCSGCGACAQICPKSVITMQYNSEGFLVPSLDESKCIHCAVCVRVCHIIQKPAKASENREAYVAYLKDNALLKYSASGGVFAKTAQMILKNSGEVFGAAWTEDFLVKHEGIHSAGEIQKLQGSKYLQSDTSSIFQLVQEALKDANKPVLFSGTPCQVAALYSYLGEDSENLVTMDLICHGVASPMFFQRYYSEMNRKYGPITAYSFRTRRKIGSSKSEFIVKMKRKGKAAKLIYHDNDVFLNLFLKGKIFRKSCYTCPYANLRRISDITIGDCDSSDYYELKYQLTSSSTVIVHSDKGKQLWDSVKDYFDFLELNLEYEARRNKQLSAPYPMPEEREYIFDFFSNMEWEQIEKTYAHPETTKTKVKNILRPFIPFNISLRKSVRGARHEL